MKRTKLNSKNPKYSKEVTEEVQYNKTLLREVKGCKIYICKLK
jgi:hypothetical protein